MGTAVQLAGESVGASVNWDAEMRGAQMLVRSGLVPQDIRTAEAALFVILAGRDLGLSAVTALRTIRPVKGKLEVSADMQLGLFHRAGGKSQWIVLTDTEASLKLVAPWSLAPHVSTFTIGDAKTAGLAGDNWRKYPKAMLRSRSITAGLKDIGFDATAGVYAPGEISDDAPMVTEHGEVIPAEVVTPDAEAFAPTDRQVEELDELLASIVWSTNERSAARKRFGKCDSAAAVDELLGKLAATIATRTAPDAEVITNG